MHSRTHLLLLLHRSVLMEKNTRDYLQLYGERGSDALDSSVLIDCNCSSKRRINQRRGAERTAMRAERAFAFNLANYNRERNAKADKYAFARPCAER